MHNTMAYEPDNKYGKPDFYSSLDSEDDYGAKAVETSVNVNTNSPPQDSTNMDDLHLKNI